MISQARPELPPMMLFPCLILELNIVKTIYIIKWDKMSIIPNKIVPTTMMLSEGDPVKKSNNV